MSHHFEPSPELEMILVKVAQEYAPKLVPANWRKPGDLSKPLPILARQLADYNVFTVMGYRGEHYSQEIPAVVRDCADTYSQLYKLLVDVLYPPLQQNKALYYSFSRDKLLLYFWLEARPVAQVFAGYISPYVVERQMTTAVADIEIHALLSMVLQKLDADDLSRAETNYIMTNGTRLIKHLLGMPLRQLRLTPFDEKFFSTIEPPLPPDLPESGSGPFMDNTITWDNTDQPDFIQQIYDPPQEPVQPRPQTQRLYPQETVEPPRPQDDGKVSGETGEQPRVDNPDEPRPRPSPARRGGLRSPLPYWRDSKKSDS